MRLSAIYGRLKRPAVPWWNLAAYGLMIGVGQFGILYIAMTAWIRLMRS